MMLIMLQVVSVALALWGTRLNAKHQRASFWYWLAANGAMMGLAVMTGTYIMIGLHIIQSWYWWQGLKHWKQLGH